MLGICEVCISQHASKRTFAVYGVNGTQPVRCFTHKNDGMVCLITDNCIGCGKLLSYREHRRRLNLQYCNRCLTSRKYAKKPSVYLTISKLLCPIKLCMNIINKTESVCKFHCEMYGKQNVSYDIMTKQATLHISPTHPDEYNTHSNVRNSNTQPPVECVSHPVMINRINTHNDTYTSPILPEPILPAPILPEPILPAPILPEPILPVNHNTYDMCESFVVKRNEQVDMVLHQLNINHQLEQQRNYAIWAKNGFPPCNIGEACIKRWSYERNLINEFYPHIAYKNDEMYNINKQLHQQQQHNTQVFHYHRGPYHRDIERMFAI